MIYAIECVGADYIKFGWSCTYAFCNGSSREKSAVRRRNQLQTGCPFVLRVILVAVWPDSEDLQREAEIHNYLAPDRARGEWFRRSERTAHVIQCMKSGQAVSL
jgi:hypothetical protein